MQNINTCIKLGGGLQGETTATLLKISLMTLPGPRLAMMSPHDTCQPGGHALLEMRNRLQNGNKIPRGVSIFDELITLRG